jgi:hypothetical protein
MKGKKLLFLYLLMALACAIPLFTLLVIISQREAAIYGSFFMEFITPTLLLSLALILYFIHKAQAA